jgi:hypothetical protein
MWHACLLAIHAWPQLNSVKLQRMKHSLAQKGDACARLARARSREGRRMIPARAASTDRYPTRGFGPPYDLACLISHACLLPCHNVRCHHPLAQPIHILLAPSLARPQLAPTQTNINALFLNSLFFLKKRVENDDRQFAFSSIFQKKVLKDDDDDGISSNTLLLYS